MYKCQKCGSSSEVRQPRQVLTEYHMLKDPVTKELTKQVKRETSVCFKCKLEAKEQPSLAPV